MNVCMYATGDHIYVKSLCTSLVEAGSTQDVNVCLVTNVKDIEHDPTMPPPPPCDVHRILPYQVPVHAYSNRAHWFCARILYFLRRRTIFLKWLKDKNINVVHFQVDGAQIFAGGLYRRLHRMAIKVVLTVHDNVTNRQYGSQLGRMSHLAARSAWMHADAICVHSGGLRDQLAAMLGPKHPPIHVTPHAVWSNVPKTPTPPPTPSQQYTHTLLFFGIIHPYKGLEVLLQAMKYLPHYRLIIAGRPEPTIGDDYMSNIHDLISMLPFDQVELQDRYIPEGSVPHLFEQSHLVVMPYTTFSSQSGVLHLALGYERPVVVTDIGAMGDSVRELGVGEVVPPGDAAGLARGIELALIPDRYKEAVRASKLAQAELTWDHTAQITIDVYRSVYRSPESIRTIGSLQCTHNS